MAEPRVHPIFGTVRQISRDNRCSACGADAGEVPLMLFGAGDDASLFCDGCAELVGQLVVAKLAAQP